MAFTEKLAETLSKISGQIVIQDKIRPAEITQVAAFDCAVIDKKLVCAVVVVDIGGWDGSSKTINVLEKKTLIKDSPMRYIPGYSAFRMGPLMLEMYYDLEHEPHVLIVPGEGIAHQDGGGLASFMGVELAKPTIGIATSLHAGELEGDNIILNGKIVGKRIITKQHAKPLFVSPGNLITVETAAELCKKLVCPPHKMPEPLHIAHRIAKKASKQDREGANSAHISESERIEQEDHINEGKDINQEPAQCAEVET